MVAVLMKVGCIIVIIIVNEQIDSNKDESPSKLEFGPVLNEYIL